MSFVVITRTLTYNKSNRSFHKLKYVCFSAFVCMHVRIYIFLRFDIKFNFCVKNFGLEIVFCVRLVHPLCRFLKVSGSEIYRWLSKKYGNNILLQGSVSKNYKRLDNRRGQGKGALFHDNACPHTTVRSVQTLEKPRSHLVELPSLC